MRLTRPMTASGAATASATALHKRLKACSATRETREKNFRTLLTSSTAEVGRTQPRENHSVASSKVSMHSRANEKLLCGKSARWLSHAYHVHSNGATRAQRHSQRVRTCDHRARSSRPSHTQHLERTRRVTLRFQRRVERTRRASLRP